MKTITFPLKILLENYDNFENYCDALKRHRVTSSQMIVRHFQTLTKEECVILLKILKPTEVDLDSNGSNRFEAILEAKQLVSHTLLHFKIPPYSGKCIIYDRPG